MKKNGFQCPWHWQQVLSWIVIICISIVFYSFTTVFFIEFKQIIMIIYAISLIIVIVVGIISTWIDPSDPMLKEELRKREECQRKNRPYVLEISQSIDFCMICCSNINSNSKHCKECDRCVNNFDHHCTWLNNCIGDENYKIFFLLLVIVFYKLSLNVILQFYAFVVYLKRTYEEESIFLINCKNMGVDIKTAAIVTVVFACFNTLIVINISYLIVMHIWLRCKGLTTYEYIINFVNKDIDKNNKDMIDHENVEKSMPFPDSKMEINSNFTKKTMFNYPVSKKNRNKIIPAELLQGFTPSDLQDKKIKVDENKGKIIFHDKDFKSKIFKPIIDNIYNNTENKSIDLKYQVDHKNIKIPNISSLIAENEYYSKNKNDDNYYTNKLEGISYNENIKIDPNLFHVLSKKV